MEIRAFLANTAAAEVILNLAVQSLLLLLAGAALSLLLKRASAPLRSGVLLAVLVLLALWPLKVAFFPAAETGLYRIPVGMPDPAEAGSLRGHAGASGPGEMAVARAIPPANASASTTESPKDDSPPPFLPPAIAAVNAWGGIWILGTLVFLGRILYGLAFLSGFKSGLREIRDPRLLAVFEEIRAAVPAKKCPPVFSSPALASPIAFGVRRPKIVLPENLLARLNPAEIRSLLIHETAHLRHRDQIAGLFQRFVAALYWWNPLVHALSARMAVAREEVSDNYGILGSGARLYAESLFGLAQKTDLINRLPSAVGIATPHISLEERIMDIISKRRNLKTRLARPVLLALVFLAAAGGLFLGRRGLALGAAEARSGFAAPAKIVPLPMVKWPTSLTVGKDRVYILDYDRAARTHEIKILSAADFSLIKSFGKRGKGPGEFLISPGTPRVVDDAIWCDDVRKVIVFSADGDFQREIPFPEKFGLLWFPLLPVGGNFVTMEADIRSLPEGSVLWSLRVYDRQLRRIKDLASGISSSDLFPAPPPPPPPPGKEKAGPKPEPRPKSVYQAIPDCVDFAVADGKIFFADSRQGFRIAVYDAAGNPLYEIRRDEEKIRVPAGFRDAFMEMIQKKSAWLLDAAEIKFRQEYPAFMSFDLVDGKIYVATYAQREGMNELMVMNLKGDILKRGFTFPLSSDFNPSFHNFNAAKMQCAVRGGKVYFLAKNEKTNGYELRIQAIE